MYYIMGYGSKPTNMSLLELNVILERKPVYYLVTVVIPCIILSALSLTMFCVPAESGEKVSIGVTILLSFFVFLVMVNDIVPEASENVPLFSK